MGMIKPLELIDLAASWWLNWRTERAYRNRPDFEEVKLLRSKMEPGNWELDLQHSMVGPLAAELGGMLDRASAKNYIQFDLFPRIDSGTKPIRVTLQWANGLSPSAVNRILRTAVDEIAEGCATPWERARWALKQCNYETDQMKDYGMNQKDGNE